MCSPLPVVQNPSAPPHRDRRAYLKAWPRSGFSTHSAPLRTRPSWPPISRTVSRRHRALTRPPQLRARAETLRLSATAGLSKPLDSSIMLAMLEPMRGHQLVRAVTASAQSLAAKASQPDQHPAKARPFPSTKPRNRPGPRFVRLQSVSEVAESRSRPPTTRSTSGNRALATPGRHPTNVGRLPGRRQAVRQT